MLLLSALFVFSSSVFIVAALKQKSKISYLLSLFLLFFTNIVLTGHIGHIFGLLNSRLFFISVEIILLILAYLYWKLSGSSDILGPFEKNPFSGLGEFCKKNVDLVLFFIGVVVALSICAYLAYNVPPNNNDSLSTHMVRVLYWLQHGDYSPWFTRRNSQLVYPVNPGLAILWTILFSGTDRWVAFVQFFSSIASALTVVGIAKSLGVKTRSAVFAGLIFLTFPTVTLQTTTTQTGLISAALFGISLYFFNVALKHKETSSFILSALSLGLALGSKQTIFFLLPGWGIAMLILWLVHKQITFRQLLLWAGTVLVSFLLLGSQIFFISYQKFGSPLGPSGSVEQSTVAFESAGKAVSQVSLNTVRFLYQFADPSGLPSPLWRWGVKSRAVIGEKLFGVLKIPIESDLYTNINHQFLLDEPTMLQEDEAWYGILGFFILVPTLIIMTVLHRNRKGGITLSIFLITVGFFIGITLFRPGWDPYQGRYFLPVMLLATSLSSFWFEKNWLRWIAGPICALVGLLILFNVTLYNPAKPILVEPVGLYYRYPQDPGYEQIGHYEPILKQTRLGKINFQSRSQRKICELIDENVPQDAVFAYSINRSYFQEYCFFGEALERTVIPLPYGDALYDINELELLDDEIEYIFLQYYKYEELPEFTYYKRILVDSDNELYILQRE